MAAIITHVQFIDILTTHAGDAKIPDSVMEYLSIHDFSSWKVKDDVPFKKDIECFQHLDENITSLHKSIFLNRSDVFKWGFGRLNTDNEKNAAFGYAIAYGEQPMVEYLHNHGLFQMLAALRHKPARLKTSSTSTNKVILGVKTFTSTPSRILLVLIV